MDVKTYRSDAALIGIVLSGLAMSVGWSFRGDYGHEAGAMVPGAIGSFNLPGLRQARLVASLDHYADVRRYRLGFRMADELWADNQLHGKFYRFVT